MSAKKQPVEIDEFDCTMTTYLDSPDLLDYELEFHEHAKRNNIDKMQLLINKKVDVNCVNKLERTAAHFAAASGHEEALMVLKEANADFELEDKCGMTPLLWAGFYGHLPAVKLIIQMFKCRTDATNKIGMNLVHVAAMNGQVILLDYISSSIQRLNATQTDKKGRTAFHIAAQAGFADVLKVLLKFRRFNLNATDLLGRTALHYSCENGNMECIEALLEEKADFDIEDNEMRTPLYLATEKGHVEVIERLLDFEHFPITVHRFQTRKSLLHVAAAEGKHIVIQKFAHRCHLEAVDEIRNTALHQAVLSRNPLCVQELLRCGAKVNALTVQGDTPLHLACQQNEPEIVYLLLQCTDIDLYKQNKRGKTALYVAAQGSFIGIVDMIIRAQLLQVREVHAKTKREMAASQESVEAQDQLDAKPVVFRRQVTFADDLNHEETNPETEEQPPNEPLCEPPVEEKAMSLEAFKREKDQELRGLRDRRRTRSRYHSEDQSELTGDSGSRSGDGLGHSKVSFNQSVSAATNLTDQIKKTEGDQTEVTHRHHTHAHAHTHTHTHAHDHDHHGHHSHEKHHDHEHHQSGNSDEPTARDSTDHKSPLQPRTKFSRRSLSGRIISPSKRLRKRREYIDLMSAASTPYDLFHDGLTRAHSLANFNMVNNVFHRVAFKILTQDSWRDLAAIWLFSHEQVRVISQQETKSKSHGWSIHAYRMLRIWFSSLLEHDYVIVTKLLVDAVEQVSAQKRVRKFKKYLLKTETESSKKLSKNIMKAKAIGAAFGHTEKRGSLALKRHSLIPSARHRKPTLEEEHVEPHSDNENTECCESNPACEQHDCEISDGDNNSIDNIEHQGGDETLNVVHDVEPAPQEAEAENEPKLDVPDANAA